LIKMKQNNKMKNISILLLTIIFLLACNGAQIFGTKNPSYPNEPSYPNGPSYPNEPEAENLIHNPYSPQPIIDSGVERGNLFLENSELLIMESFPVQITLVLEGNLPTPCHQIRVAAHLPDEQNRLQVEVYSVFDPAEICIQTLDPFKVNIALGSFPTGHYSVLVNGDVVGEFDS